MEYCKYHPLVPATYRCEHCDIEFCDHCVDEGNNNQYKRCFTCGRELESLGARYNAEPFWRRLQESFHYPLNTGTIILIIGMACLAVVVSFLPFAIIWHLMLVGAFMKYCFSCLEKTAKGSFRSPDITAAYDGGFIIALQLIAMVVIIAGATIGINIWLGVGMATLFGGIVMCCIPAILINFALTENILDAINPLRIIYLISAIGLPYGLLLGLMMVMMGSVSVISQLLGDNLSFLNIVLQFSAFNYYIIVAFHIMGYMIFQYQGQLGFIAQDDNKKRKHNRSDIDRLLVKIEIFVKEGEYDEAISLFHDAIKKYPNDKNIYNKYFDFIIAIKDKELIDEYAPFHFKFLNQTHSEDLITRSYKRILQVHPKYIPDTAEDRLMLAKECKQSGDSRTAVKLLNGINKTFPDFAGLGIVYELMADALRDIPKMADKADQFEALSKRFIELKRKKTMVKKRGKRIPPKELDGKSVIETIEDNAKKNDGLSYDGGIDFN